MAQLFPIPMALGVLEAGQVSAFAIIRSSANAGVALAFLVRNEGYCHRDNRVDTPSHLRIPCGQGRGEPSTGIRTSPLK